jgi:hypothetical protein
VRLEVPKDRVRFGEIAAGRDFEQRHLAVRILGQELRRAAVALEDIDLDQAVGMPSWASASRTL